MFSFDINRTRSPMTFSLFLLLSLFLGHVGTQIVCQSSDCNRSTVTIPGVIGKPFHFTVNDSSDYLLEFKNPPNVSSTTPARVTVQCEDATNKYPLLIVLRQTKGVLSWQIPFGSLNSTKTARTLCPDSSHFHETNSEIDDKNSFFVNFYTRSSVDLHVVVNVTIVDDFTIKMGQWHNVPSRNFDGFTPSEPHYYQFDWPTNLTDVAIANVRSDEMSQQVVLRVESDSDTCMTLSIQHISCPVLDLERTVEYEGYRQTIDEKGGVTIEQDEFQTGFFVVFVLNSDDKKCRDKSYTRLENPGRQKTLRFLIEKTIGSDEYVIAIMAPLVVIISVYVLFFVAAIVFSCRPYPETSSVASTSASIQEIASASAEAGCDRSEIEDAVEPDYGPPGDDASLVSVRTRKRRLRQRRVLYVSDLAQDDPVTLRQKSDMYVMNLVTVAVFYSLPVFQLMLSYQTTLQKTGNQDQCYYNFLCSHPFGISIIRLSDFNHVFSNVGYVLLGLLFILWTSRRDAMHQRSVTSRPELDQRCGIPQHYGLFYAMGLALIMEGILSGLYHICPNETNFQFDTSFMYVIAVLCMVKLYQNRHPDINASAYFTFMVLAGIIFVGMIGIREESAIFFAFFSVIHVIMCLWVSLQVYHMGCWSVGAPGRGSLVRFTRDARDQLLNNSRAFFTPKYPSRMALLVVGNILNWSLVYLGSLYEGTNFGSHLLLVLLTNLMLYFLFYILMKLLNREKMMLESLLYFLASCALWGLSLYYFLKRVTSWQNTPAGSRRINEECTLLHFYDKHDIWHFLSAGGMFCTFMVLLTLDDDLIEVHRTRIPVF